jgi:glutamine amidotransferase-like uncharacterized protein
MDESKKEPVPRAAIILAALLICWVGATWFDRRHVGPAPSPIPEARGLEPLPEAPERIHAAGAPDPIEASEAREPIFAPEPREMSRPRVESESILSSEARESIDSLAKSAAATRPIRVGLFNDKSCCDEPGPLSRILESIPLCTWELVLAAEIVASHLAQFDVVIFPGGRAHLQAKALGEHGRRVVQEFVHNGGGYVGVCAGCFLATAQYPWSLGLVNTRTLHGNREMPGVGIKSMADRGPGTVQTEFTEAGRAIFGGHASIIDVGFAGGPILLGPMCDDLPPFVPLAYYRTELVNYEPQRGTMINTPAIVAAKFGAGHVVAIGPHPETTQGLEFLVKRSVLATARKTTGQAVRTSNMAASSATQAEIPNRR